MREDLVSARRLAISSAVMTAGVGRPLFLEPYRWAGWFGWPEEPQTNLGNYFGRCLGATALAGTASAVRTARAPEQHRSHFTWLEISSWLLAAAHVRGAIERRQPTTETVEILGWAALAVAARRFAPDGSADLD